MLKCVEREARSRTREWSPVGERRGIRNPLFSAEEPLLSTVSLVGLIADSSDRGALSELLQSRPLFVFDDENLVLSGFLWELRCRDADNHPVEIVNCTYDRALDRFARLPDSNSG